LLSLTPQQNSAAIEATRPLWHYAKKLAAQGIEFKKQNGGDRFLLDESIDIITIGLAFITPLICDEY
jgi:hypothetical protein